VVLAGVHANRDGLVQPFRDQIRGRSLGNPRERAPSKLLLVFVSQDDGQLLEISPPQLIRQMRTSAIEKGVRVKVEQKVCGLSRTTVFSVDMQLRMALLCGRDAPVSRLELCSKRRRARIVWRSVHHHWSREDKVLKQQLARYKQTGPVDRDCDTPASAKE